MAMLCGAHPAPHLHPDHRAVPLRAGDGADAGWWIGAALDEITYTCAGINHQAWYLDFKVERRGCLSADPQGDHRERPEIYNEEQVRNEMYLALGYYVTESSGHNSEYNWWFRKRPDLIEKYCTHGTGWNPGEYAYILKEYQTQRSDLERSGRGMVRRRNPDRHSSAATNMPRTSSTR